MSAPAEFTSVAVATVDWSRTGYRAALTRQENLVTQRIASEIPDTLVFTEHDPVFTIGLRRGAETHLVWDAPTRAADQIAVEQTNRGGDITYHGPGQLVVYPIVSLESRRDLHAYLRFLEQVILMSLLAFGLDATRREGKTGIWIGRRKIAAIGVAVRRWVTYHGFALNVDPNLGHFAGIVPCGIDAAEGSVTSMAKELGRSIELASVKPVVDATFRQQLGRMLNRTQAEKTADLR